MKPGDEIYCKKTVSISDIYFPFQEGYYYKIFMNVPNKQFIKIKNHEDIIFIFNLNDPNHSFYFGDYFLTIPEQRKLKIIINHIINQYLILVLNIQ